MQRDEIQFRTDHLKKANKQKEKQKKVYVERTRGGNGEDEEGGKEVKGKHVDGEEEKLQWKK